MLIKAGAQIETKDDEGFTSLSRAAYNGYESVVRLLIQNGAHIETKDQHNRTPLYHACARSHLPLAHWLVYDHNADINCELPDGMRLVLMPSRCWRNRRIFLKTLAEGGLLRNSSCPSGHASAPIDDITTDTDTPTYMMDTDINSSSSSGSGDDDDANGGDVNANNEQGEGNGGGRFDAVMFVFSTLRIQKSIAMHL